MKKIGRHWTIDCDTRVILSVEYLISLFILENIRQLTMLSCITNATHYLSIPILGISNTGTILIQHWQKSKISHKKFERDSRRVTRRSRRASGRNSPFRWANWNQVGSGGVFGGWRPRWRIVKPNGNSRWFEQTEEFGGNKIAKFSPCQSISAAETPCLWGMVCPFIGICYDSTRIRVPHEFPVIYYKWNQLSFYNWNIYAFKWNLHNIWYMTTRWCYWRGVSLRWRFCYGVRHLIDMADYNAQIHRFTVLDVVRCETLMDIIR